MASQAIDNYVGTELTLFARATHWADYVGRQLAPYLGGTVVEVGAGQGTRTRALSGQASRWVAIEPDLQMADALASEAARGELAPHVNVVCGTLADVPRDVSADTIIYLDVLEHIEDDRSELERAARLLGPGGRLVVLAPAHQSLYSEFDRAVGHYRRYNIESLRTVGPPALTLEVVRMLDTAGLLASAANRLVLRSSMPTISQVLTWDRLMVPVSRMIDGLLGYRFGKSVLMVWRKPS